MYAEIPKDQVPEKSPLLQPGQVYSIGRFRVRAAKTSYMPISASLMIEFTYYTQIEALQIPPERFPAYIQTIVPFNEVGDHVKEHPDFIGELYMRSFFFQVFFYTDTCLLCRCHWSHC